MGSKFTGIDIESSIIELVVVEEAGNIVQSLQTNTGFYSLQETWKKLNDARYDLIMATGYSRNLFEIAFNASTVTEIKAHASDARAFFPEALAILDIGGQDSKAIALSENGKPPAIPTTWNLIKLANM